ncbi:HEPN domain-containing protein [Variovorax sp. RA8]|uniref:HEPN domain-containing protein n=1 Tax=Variovorax sp. (strain JCM 16519 / RA8) TaxID=662548 RepID=UPI0013A56FB7|nr:HEPN domain-containing protein [Variovorax sp. RA8]
MAAGHFETEAWKRSETTVNQENEFVAILRCQTWNVWPERSGVESRDFSIDYGSATPIPARLVILSYAGRPAPERYLNEETKFGPLVWDGKTPGLHRVRDAILKSPDDVIELSLVHRNAHRGEVDILINFKLDGEPTLPLLEALRATAYATMSLVNLKLNDVLTVAAPFQVRKELGSGRGSMETSVHLSMQKRYTLEKSAVHEALVSIASLLSKPPYGEKFRVALELYAAHFNEEQVRVRFLLLVIAMEALATPTRKHDAAMVLLDRWKVELASELSRLDSSSEEFMSLEALRRELDFRGDDSIRSQVRKLFANLEDVNAEESRALQRRALHVYDKRSVLVHDGYLPKVDLVQLESEARELLENLFMHAAERHGSRIDVDSST